MAQNKCQRKSRKFTWNKYKYKESERLHFLFYYGGFISKLIENIDYFISLELALKYVLLEAERSSTIGVILLIKVVDPAFASCYSS